MMYYGHTSSHTCGTLLGSTGMGKNGGSTSCWAVSMTVRSSDACMVTVSVMKYSSITKKTVLALQVKRHCEKGSPLPPGRAVYPQLFPSQVGPSCCIPVHPPVASMDWPDQKRVSPCTDAVFEEVWPLPVSSRVPASFQTYTCQLLVSCWNDSHGAAGSEYDYEELVCLYGDLLHCWVEVCSN